MKRFVLLLLVVIVISTLVFTSCNKTGEPATQQTTATSQPQYGGTINYCWSSDMPYIDPWNGAYNAMLSGLIYDKLAMGNWGIDRKTFAFQYDYVPIDVYKGMLAESWTVNDPTSFTIKIRQGIHWQNKPPVNGRELTANDVKYAYDRMLGTGSGFTEASPNSSGLAYFPWKSIDVVDKYTLNVTLSEPSIGALVSFLGDSYEAWVYPPEVIQQYGEANDWQRVVGTGPYMIANHVQDSSWTLTKNPDYWCYDEKYPKNKLPYTDNVNISIIPDPALQMAALRTGKVDFLNTYGNSMSATKASDLLKTNPELVQFKIQDLTLGVAMRSDRPPLNDIRVRQALQMSINREEIADGYFKGEAVTTPVGQLGPAMGGYYTPYAQWPDDVKAGYAYNPDQAKKLMAAAGYSNGLNLTLDICPDFWPSFSSDIAQLVKSYFSKINVNLTIKTVELAAYTGNMNNRGADDLQVTQSYGWNIDPLVALNVFYQSSSIWNAACVNDPAYDALVAKASSAPTYDELKNYVKQADMYSIRQQWELVLVAPYQYTLAQPWLRGYSGEFSLGGGSYHTWFARVWIDSSLK